MSSPNKMTVHTEKGNSGTKGKHTFVYKKLVVPMSMRSIYWKCYGFPANEDGDILTKVKIVCLLCKTVIAYNRNTSNLRMHMQNKHRRELQELELTAPPRKPKAELKVKKPQKKSVKNNPSSFMYTTDTEGAVQVDGNIQVISDPNISVEEFGTQNFRVVMKGMNNDEDDDDDSPHVTYMMPDYQPSNDSPLDKNKISDAIAEFVILDLQLPDVVELSGFQRLIATLRSPCEIPSKPKLVEEIIPKIYETYRDSLLETISLITNEVTISIEEWQSSSSDSYVTFTIHFLQQDSEDSLQSRVLSSYHCSSLFDCDQWAHVIDSLFLDWGIKQESVKAIIIATDQLPLVSALALRSYTLIPCLVHTLQDVCTQGCFSKPQVSKILVKIRMLLNFIFENSNAQSTLRIQENLLQLEDVQLSTDYPKAWISTYVMLEQLYVRRTIIGSVIDQLDLTLDENEKENLTLTDDEWSVIQDVVNVLEPFKVATMTLAEEKAPLISLLSPLLWQLTSVHLKTRDCDSALARELKLTLSSMLKDRYSEDSVEEVLKVASTLDPRFKSLPYAMEEVKDTLYGIIKTSLIQLIDERGNLTNADEEPATPSKKPRLSGMEFLLGDVCLSSSALSNKERGELEIAQYQSEPTASLEQCPLLWWQKASLKFANLARLASSYTCIPATAIPPIRISVENQINFGLKRANLSPDLIDKIIFLNSNYII